MPVRTALLQVLQNPILPHRTSEPFYPVKNTIKTILKKTLCVMDCSIQRKSEIYEEKWSINLHEQALPLLNT